MIDRQKTLNEQEMEALGRARALRTSARYCPGIRRYIQAVASKLTRDKGRLTQALGLLPGGTEALAFAAVSTAVHCIHERSWPDQGDSNEELRKRKLGYPHVGVPVVFLRWEVARALYCEVVYHKATPFGRKAIARIYKNPGRGFSKLADAAARATKDFDDFFAHSGPLFKLARQITQELECQGFLKKECPKPKNWYYRLHPKIEADFWHLREEFAKPLWLPLLDTKSSEAGSYPQNPLPLLKRRKNQLPSTYSKPTIFLQLGLKKLGDLPWRINEPLLKIVESLWGRYPELGLPDPNIQASVPIPYPLPKEVHRKRQVLAMVHLERRHRAAALHRGARAVWTARQCVGHVVRFPVQADWRGRIYTLCTALSYQGEDLHRALLTLDNGSRDDVAYKCEGARLWGSKLSSLSERVAWTESQAEEIERVRRDPEGSVDYWSQADDPWQFLAWCLDENRMTWLDGSANGLQHFALMSESLDLAQRVNLTPGDPTDIYQQALDILRPLLETDIEGRAWLQSGLVDRKFVKKVVMTLPYGITQYGIREHVDATLFRLGPRQEEVTQGDPYHAAKYLVGRLQEMQQKLLGPEVEEYIETLKEMARAGKKGVQWNTRGVRIEQTYVQPSLLRSALYGRIADLSRPLRVSVQAQVARILPNWVHSHDAEHLLRLLGVPDLQVVPVHDSFGGSQEQWHRLRRQIRVKLAIMYPAAAEKFNLAEAEYSFW